MSDFNPKARAVSDESLTEFNLERFSQVQKGDILAAYVLDRGDPPENTTYALDWSATC